LKAKVVKPFRDLKENVKRKKGETFTVSQERFQEINSTRFGKLVEKVVEKKPKRKNEKVGDK